MCSYYICKKLIEKYQDSFNNFLFDENKRIEESYEFSCENFARKFKMKKSNNERENVIRDFVSFIKETNFSKMRLMLDNAVVQWGLKGIKIVLPPFDQLSYRRTTSFFQSERLKELEMKPDFHSVFELSLYGIDKDLCIKLNDAGYHDIDSLYEECIKTDGKSLRKIKGIGNGQRRKIKKCIMDNFLFEKVDINEPDDIDIDLE